MDHSHRRRLDAFCEALIPYIDMTILWPYLIQNRIYDRDDVNVPVWKVRNFSFICNKIFFIIVNLFLYLGPFFQKKLNDLETIRDIFLTIKTRGPEAYENLLLSLRQSEHEILAELLESESSDSNLR